MTIRIYDEEVLAGDPLLEIFSNNHRNFHIGEHIRYECGGETVNCIINSIFNCFTETGNIDVEVFVKRV
jgi:hypothetical protein